MSHERPSPVGFCIADDNADLIADALVRRMRESASEMESHVNRLYRGRRSYELNVPAKLDLEKTVRRLNYMAETLREVQKAQGHRVMYLQAAE
jgi:hypothetical protein